MKRFTFLFVVLAFCIAAAVAVAAPAPKTTGDVGYTAYSTVQRHLEFNAIQTMGDACGTFWNVTHTTSFTYFLTGDLVNGYKHHVTLTQNGETVGGFGGFPFTGAETYNWTITAGAVVGNTLTLTMTYALGAPGTVMHMTGTIAANGSISGSWSDNFGGTRTGTFTAPAGSATVVTGTCAKGTAYYSDDAGLWYVVDVQAVSVSGADAWFAGPVVSSNFGAEGNWLFVKNHDGGEPAYLVDQVWGSFASESAALAGVALHGTPADGPFSITSGNLQVH